MLHSRPSGRCLAPRKACWKAAGRCLSGSRRDPRWLLQLRKPAAAQRSLCSGAGGSSSSSSSLLHLLLLSSLLHIMDSSSGR